MSEQDNIRIAEQAFGNLNAHQISSDGENYAEDYHFDGPGAQGSLNLEQFQAYLQGFFDSFPDLHFEITHKIADGDYVVINWKATGTHTGPMRTPSGNMIPATGKKGMVPGSTFYEFKNGKITHSQSFWDMSSLLAQLGLLPL